MLILKEYATLTQQVAVWMRMQNAKIQSVTAVKNTLISKEHAKQVILIIVVPDTGIVVAFKPHASMVVNKIIIDNFAFLLNCTTMGQSTDCITATSTMCYRWLWSCVWFSCVLVIVSSLVFL